MSSTAFERWWRDEGSAMRPSPGEDAEEHAKRVAQIAWSNGEYVTNPVFSGLPKRKLENLLAQGYRINGVSIQRSSPDGVTIERGAVTTGGMVLWWQQDNTDLLAEAHKRIAELEAACLEQVDLTISLRDRLKAKSA